MTCPACAHGNRPGAKFCEECAAPLKRACASCGTELRPTAKFCDECGASAAAAPSPTPAGARKTVTILFADLVGSTALHERLDPESARRFMESYYAAARGAVEEHGGTVTQLLGDGVKAVFGIPRVAEDDALRAVHAAVAMQDAFRALADEQRGAIGPTGLRVAVNTGEVVASGESEIIGDPVNVAARLQEQGRDGDVVVGEATYRLVETRITAELLGSFALKGRAETVRAYRVVSLEARSGAATAAFVGRGEELGRITAVFDAAVATPATRLAVLLGSPGLGKSRLIGEFARRSGETATVVSTHCDAAGGVTFAPIASGLGELLGIEAGAAADVVGTSVEAALPEDDERGRIARGVAALLTGAPAPPEETFFVVRRLLAGLAATRPVVLLIDDLQWAEPLLLDLVEHLVQWGTGVPLLVLVGARPELRDARSSLVVPGGLVSDVLTLGGLDAGAAMRLAANVIGAADLPAAVAAKVLATSEGNPLFIGELVRMLVHEGALTREGDRWTTGTALATLEMPPTIQAVLAARIERLGPEERTLLERAAVVGRHFSRSAVAELLPRNGSELDARLESLRRAELIERDTGWFLGEPVLRFHHVLIRDVAYRRILKGTRAELHARLADWIATRVGDAAEHDETIGRHLEQAHQLLGELGPLDESGRRLGERAASRLAAAGRRALARDDVPLAAGLLGRALERLAADDPARADLALDWCEALLAAGDVSDATAAIDELGRFTHDSPRLRAWHACFAGQHTVLTAPETLHATAERVATAAGELAELGDAAGEAKAHFVHALALARLGQVGGCEAALDRALAAARRAGDRRRANTVLAIAPLAALWGPSPVTRASGRCLDVVRVLRITQGAPAVEAVALSCQGVLEALRGRTDAARRMIASARKMVEELGIMQRLFDADVSVGLVALLEGDAAAAERSLRGAYEGFRDLGLGIDAARAAALLARALLALDRAADAEKLSHESEALAGDDLKAAIAWRGVRAEALARRGEHAAAVELAGRAVELAGATDALLDHADARLALAAALRAAGRDREADAEERRAHELWETKGATLLGERAGREHTGAEAVPATPGAPVSRQAPAPRRRVRPSAALAWHERFCAAMAARDVAAVRALRSDDFEAIDHPTGSTYGADASMASLERAFGARDVSFGFEPLATLGPSLVLVRSSIEASGVATERYDVGEYEYEAIFLREVDEHGRLRRSEIFAAERLGDARARLYERHAELLPEGPARDRATRTARAVRASCDVDRVTDAVAPDVDIVDHRTLGTWGGRGADVMRRNMEALGEVATDVVLRDDDVLALDPGALLVRRTHLGTDRRGGGPYERPFLVLLAFGADGLVERWEWFDVGHEAEALARFEELTGAAPPSPAPPPRRRVHPNAASVAGTRIEAAIRERDLAALAAVLSEDLETVDHSMGTTWGRDGEIESCRRMFRLPDLEFRMDLLATIGERLSLGTRRVRGSATAGGAFDVAEYEMEHHVVSSLDDTGRFSRLEVFAADHLYDAIVRLYERHAELFSPGPERDRATAIARTLASNIVGDPSNAFAPAIEVADHRLVGMGVARGVEAALTMVRSLYTVARDLIWRFDDVLALSPEQLLARVTNVGTARDSGGEFEREICGLFRFGADGRITHLEVFEADQERAALARFDALVGERKPQDVSCFANVARRLGERYERCWRAGDWEGVAAVFSPAFRFDDRRRLNRIELGAEDFLVQFRMLFDQPGSRWEQSLVATRGERAALGRVTYRAEVEGGGPLEIAEAFALYEVGPDGRAIATVLFDVEDEDAAWAELDRRYAAGEGANTRSWVLRRELVRAVAHRDWERVKTQCAESVVQYDHRSMAVLGTAHGPEAWVGTMRPLFELAPDTAYRLDHFRSAPRGFYSHGGWRGTREGGPYEIPVNAVFEFDARGRVVRTDLYDDDGVDAALARFAEVAAISQAPADRFANAATRWFERGVPRYHARAWSELEQSIAPDFRCSDRRRTVRLELDRAEHVRMLRSFGEMDSARIVLELLGTRGERLALYRVHVEVAGGDVGPSDLEHLNVVETDARGKLAVGWVRLDADDLDAAHAELDARYEAAGADSAAIAWQRSFRMALASRDWDALAGLMAPSFEGHDHRLVGWGTFSGPGATDALVRAARAMVELAPDARVRTTHERASSRAGIWEAAWFGTRDGGAFESPYVLVVELDAHGRAQRLDFYDPHHTERAWARYEEIARSATAAEALNERFANAATRAVDRGMAAIAVRDWHGFGTLFAPGFRAIDRTPLAQIESGRDEWLAAFREIIELTVSQRHEVLATRGDRLALVRAVWQGAEGDVGPSEIRWLIIIEVDERGDHTAVVSFDPSDLDGAYAELDTRWDGGPGAANVRANWDAISRRDRDYARTFAPSVRTTDHRLLGWGTILEDATTMLRAQQALVELAPDARYRVDHARVQGRASLWKMAQLGTREGGAFETPIVITASHDETGRFLEFDAYDPEQLEQAWARFTELGAGAPPDPLAAIRKPNLASRFLTRWEARFNARDWVALEALHVPDVHWEDRRRLFRLSGGTDLAFASVRERAEAGARAACRVLGIAGERVAIARLLYTGGPPDGRFEIEMVGVAEVDQVGRAAAIVLFDPDDRHAAIREAWRRWVAIDPTVEPPVALMGEAMDAYNACDRARVRAVYADDVVVEDHRLTGFGRLEGADAYTDSLAVLWDISSSNVELGWWWPAVRPDGAVVTVRRFGTLPEGGDFESDYLYLFLQAGGRTTHVEIFELDALDAALARFEALRPDRGVPPPAERDPLAAVRKPNAANAALDRWQAQLAADPGCDDMEAWRRLCAPHMVFEDRQRHALVSGDRDLMVASARERAATGARPVFRLIGTAGDRIAVYRVLWTGGPADARFEVEYLALVEVDEAGLFAAIVLFSHDDARAARREAGRWWIAIDPTVAPMLRLLAEGTEAFNACDRPRVRALYADDLVVEDHRRTGMGRIEGADAYVESLVTLWDLASVTTAEGGAFWPAFRPDGGVTVARRSGDVRDGGAFESEFLYLFLHAGGRITHIELFELDALDTALARFEALRPDPLRIPPNAATRTNDRRFALAEAGDWDAVRALSAPTVHHEDRRRLFRNEGDASSLATELEFLFGEAGGQVERTLLATAGNRLALERERWTSRDPERAFEMDVLSLTEVDAEGRVVAVVLFDADDRAGAHDALWERWVASRVDGMPAGIPEIMRTWNAYDLGRLRALLSADFHCFDHRRTGMGDLTAGEYLDSLRALFELSPDHRLELVYSIRAARHGVLGLFRRVGSNAEGGETEGLAIAIFLCRGDSLAGLEVFEPEYLDAALARFEALRPRQP